MMEFEFCFYTYIPSFCLTGGFLYGTMGYARFLEVYHGNPFGLLQQGYLPGKYTVTRPTMSAPEAKSEFSRVL